eukprot:CAMPEP_0197584312 /NCGR_PEP_ID=MMETSP1326-20131121/6980_1 /TAXON_ID=1155430 /ORGANISM="Genus nov. species nov., Strain RCC2288" /LENGTH=108 /DNA_ID=CAMNT_0043148667 /DNA_START=298 /DNA_END=623 /DNA_ORIENTATION=-
MSLSRSCSSILNTFSASPRLMPVLNALRPAPVKITARTDLSSAMPLKALAKSTSIVCVMAFTVDAESMVTVTMPGSGRATRIDMALGGGGGGGGGRGGGGGGCVAVVV